MQLLAWILPYENGQSTMSVNGGIIYNKGIEFTVSFTAGEYR